VADRSGAPRTSAAGRALWLDNLRIALIAGVIVAHVATAYVVDVDWYYEERTTTQWTSTLLSFPVLLAAVFGLGPLFLVAGALSSGSLARKGPASFVRGRLLRLGVPMLVYLFLIDPVTDYLGRLRSDQPWTLWDCLSNRTGTRDLGPLWFVSALLVFSLVYAGWRSVRTRKLVTGQVLPLATLVLASGLIAAGSWATWLHWTYTSDIVVNLNFAHWPQDAVLFALGAMAGERGWLETVSRERARRFGWVAAVGILAVAVVAGLALGADDIEAMYGGVHWQAATFAAASGVVAVALPLWLVGLFRRHWDHQGDLAKRASRGCYAAYLLHPPVLVLLSLAALSLPVSPEVKFVLVAALGVPAAFLVGYGAAHVPGVRRVV
jgi:fucose 4-O-acetylase-like acetyltransferase